MVGAGAGLLALSTWLLVFRNVWLWQFRAVVTEHLAICAPKTTECQNCTRVSNSCQKLSPTQKRSWIFQAAWSGCCPTTRSRCSSTWLLGGAAEERKVTGEPRTRPSPRITESLRTTATKRWSTNRPFHFFVSSLVFAENPFLKLRLYFFTCV